ncbi:hypothetical protein RB195_014367 [Necator americanus]|uniref:Uncharacterized protein n=1 Tax=Necator americanus TaxID=51031 RepID=A0ABR1E096_NECAM
MSAANGVNVMLVESDSNTPNDEARTFSLEGNLTPSLMSYEISAPIFVTTISTQPFPGRSANSFNSRAGVDPSPVVVLSFTMQPTLNVI